MGKYPEIKDTLKSIKHSMVKVQSIFSLLCSMEQTLDEVERSSLSSQVSSHSFTLGDNRIVFSEFSEFSDVCIE